MSSGQVKAVGKLREVTFEFGGEEHPGRLPAGAARALPAPVEVAVVGFEIRHYGDGYTLR